MKNIKKRKKIIPDVRLIVENALRPLKIPVGAEKYDIKSNDTEYIVYFVEDERNGHYADNVPHLRKSSVAVYYVTKSLNNKLTRPDKIISAMEKHNFKVTVRQIDLTNPRQIDNLLSTGWSGVRQEYILERFF